MCVFVFCRFYLENYVSDSSGQSRSSIVQETKDIFSPSETLEQQLSCTVQICDQHCKESLSKQANVVPS